MLPNPKIFVTGVSGYIGGTVFDTLIKQYEHCEYTVLIRSESSAQKFQDAYPSVKIIRGDLDSLDVIETEAANSDIVVNTADNDHTASIAAIVRGLSRLDPQLEHMAPKNRYLIHTSGTSILLDEAFGRGTETAHLYDDGPRRFELIHDLSDDAWHRDVDKLVLLPNELHRPEHVHVAIVCPPCVYGRGTGTGKIVSWQLPQMVKHFIKRGKGFTVDKGDAVWGNVHVQDLADIYSRLFALALKENDDERVWDTAGGYYLAASGEHHWGDTMRLVAQILYEQGKITSADVDQLSPDEVRALGAKTGPLEWGCNSRGKATHAREVLGWKPQRGELDAIASGSESWGVGVPLGVGKKELEYEVAMFEEGLCK